MIQLLMLVTLSYGLGSINGAYYVVKLMSSKDIRLLGSGNAGARNAGRQLGKKGFLLTLFIDVGKTLIVLAIVDHVFIVDEMQVIICATCVLLGHIWPIQMQFHGGKGVVVFLATVLFLAPVSILIAGVFLGIGYLIFRKFTLTGLFAMLTIPVSSWSSGQTTTVTLGLLLMLVIVIFAHVFPTSASVPNS